MATVNDTTGVLNSGAAGPHTTASYTPAAGDLEVMCLMAANTVIDGTAASSVGGETYTLPTNGKQLSGAASSIGEIWVGDQFTTNVAKTWTLTLTGDNSTAGYLQMLTVTGMSKTGAAAVRQVKGATGAALTPPEVVFDSSCLTENPTIMLVAQTGNNRITTPSGWTEVEDAGGSGRALAVYTRDSGFTGTTITSAGNASNAWWAIAIELDASAAGATITPSQGNLVLSVSAPVVQATAHRTISPGAGQLVLSPTAPQVSAGASKTVSPASGNLALTGRAPTVQVSDHRVVAPAAAQLVLTGSAPTVQAGGSKVVSPGGGQLALSAAAPTVARTDHRTVAPAAGNLVISGSVPQISVGSGVLISPTAAQLLLSGFMPITINSAFGPGPRRRIWDGPAAARPGGAPATPRPPSTPATPRP